MITITQLEYIVAVDNHRHFARAAAHCFVTQPTLSMQIKKLEDDLGIKIFDRNRQPVIPTDIGKLVIDQARRVLQESGKITELVKDYLGEINGELRIGIIPTLAPYLLPMFAGNFRRKYPGVHLHVEEQITEKLADSLKTDQLDAAVFVTPFNDDSIMEEAVFYEEMLVYAHHNHPLLSKSKVGVVDIAIPELWLLSDGHCFRSQVINLCSLHQMDQFELPFSYEGGSIETLIRIIDREGGVTIIPELAVAELSANQQANVISFDGYKPLREVSVCFSRHFAKNRLIRLLADEIRACVPKHMLQLERGELVLWK
jgi:LysR family transcriptional regulator, hydrogen peroxide-inducible genes activator